MSKHLEKNTFFGINKFPKGWGMIAMPVSMSRISTGQTPEKCIEWILDFGVNKVTEPKIGLNFIYTDQLYFNSSEMASVLKEKFMHEVIKHKNALLKLIKKNKKDLQIEHAFSFSGWSDLYLNSKNFNDNLREIRRLYETDGNLQKYISEDARHYERALDSDHENFFLEESLALYLILFDGIEIKNEYVIGREEWLLVVYPGVPPKGLVYLCQKNPLNLNTDNPYIGQYNLENSKFYNFNNIDLDTWNYE